VRFSRWPIESGRGVEEEEEEEEEEG